MGNLLIKAMSMEDKMSKIRINEFMFMAEDQISQNCAKKKKNGAEIASKK